MKSILNLSLPYLLGGIVIPGPGPRNALWRIQSGGQDLPLPHPPPANLKIKKSIIVLAILVRIP